jgi:ribosome-binding ATPase
MKFGLVGLPNVGKSTIFNLIVGQELARASNFPFCTIDPNSAITQVMDEKIQKLGEISKSEKLVFPRLECVDIAGLVKGASQGAGLGNQFLSHIRQVDLILHVVRFFEDPDIQHVNNKVDPISDSSLINDELMIADIDMCEKILGNKKASKLYTPQQIKAMEKAMEVLNRSVPIRREKNLFTQDELKFINERGLITAKPMLYVANVDSYDEKSLGKFDSSIIKINPMDPAGSIDYLIGMSYKELGLITFYTTGPTESRGWSVKLGSQAKKAAGVIHSDFEKKFIAASVIKYDDFIDRSKSIKPRIEGANYLIQDGDICEFRVGR